MELFGTTPQQQQPHNEELSTSWSCLRMATTTFCDSNQKWIFCSFVQWFVRKIHNSSSNGKLAKWTWHKLIIEQQHIDFIFHSFQLCGRTLATLLSTAKKRKFNTKMVKWDKERRRPKTKLRQSKLTRQSLFKWATHKKSVPSSATAKAVMKWTL